MNGGEIHKKPACFTRCTAEALPGTGGEAKQKGKGKQTGKDACKQLILRELAASQTLNIIVIIFANCTFK